MSDIQQALRMIYSAIDAVNRPLPASARLSQSPDTVIVGPASQLDSLGLINFVVACEQAIEDQAGVGISLTEENLIADAEGPLRSVESLAAYIASQLLEAVRERA